MKTLRSAPTALPADCVWVRALKIADRSEVHLVEFRGERRVVRLVPRAHAPTAGSAAALLARVSSSCVPGVERWGETSDGGVFLVEPYVEGEPFTAAVRGADLDEVVDWVRVLLSGLADLHAAGLVHRDIKSDNVLVGSHGPTLIDFDLLGPVATRGAVGSAGHISPEVLAGLSAEPASDLFGLGAMIAFAFCGPPSPQFHTRFPARAFWESAELDPESVPSELRGLVLQLVRRHPNDRPSNARAAAALLPGDTSVAPPEVRLPFLAGRDAVLSNLVDMAKAGVTTLVALEEFSEQEYVTQHIQLSLAARGARVARVEVADPGVEATVTRADVDALVTSVSEHEPRDVAAFVATVAMVSTQARPALFVVLPRQQARRVRQSLADILMDDELERVEFVTWPRPHVAALRDHLTSITGATSPKLADALAHTLSRRSDGHWSELNRLLVHACDVGVLAPADGMWSILRDFEAHELPEREGGDDCASLDAAARALLSALAMLGGRAHAHEATEVAQLDEAGWVAGSTLLRRRGIVGYDWNRDGELRVVDPRWLDAIERSRSDSGDDDARRRSIQVLERRAGSEALVARQRALLAGTASEFHEVVTAAGELRRRGDVGAARALLLAVKQRLRPGMHAVERAIVLESARLDLAQGSAEQALDRLERVYGEFFETDDASVLLVAAEAAETAGRRHLARDLYARVRASRANKSDRLRAAAGEAFAIMLDGNCEEALAVCEGLPRARDPDEASAIVLNLKVVALSRLGRLEEAALALDDARRRAERCGDATLQGRVELNGAFLDRRRGHFDTAIAAIHHALDLFTSAGHVKYRALAANNLGVLQRDLGDLTQARAWLEESLALRRRVGDKHGSASTLGSLGGVLIDAGQISASLHVLRRARALMDDGTYGSERSFVDLLTATALALAGRHTEAAELLSQAEAAKASLEHPSLVRRVDALIMFGAGQIEAARRKAREANEQAEERGNVAEAFRSAWLWCTLERESVGAVDALARAERALRSPIRSAETDWRLRDLSARTPRKELEGWLDHFSRGGRTMLVRTVALELAEAYDDAGDIDTRRQLMARAAEASDALLDGLPAYDHASVLERLSVLGGGDASHRRDTFDVDWFVSCNRRMASEDGLEELLLAIVDMALGTTDARRGFLVLLSDGDTHVRVARGMSDLGEEAQLSGTVVREAIETREAVVAADARTDDRFDAVASVANLSLRSVLCVPLLGGIDRGALYLDNDERAAAFDDEDVRRVRVLADQASIAIGNLRRREEVEDLSRRLRDRVDRQDRELTDARMKLRSAGAIPPAAGLVGRSDAFRAVLDLVDRLGPTDLPVLLTGASGAGKGVVAQALHDRSQRASGPLVIENMAAVPASLLESELFGHVRGAFTGAIADRKGLFAEADGGTLFLDEIAEAPIEVQAKLLRVLEDGQFRPVGASVSLRANVRILAASNKNLEKMVHEGTFREDLFYRLDVASVRVPSLTEREGDIPMLVEFFLEQLNTEHGTSKRITQQVMSALVRRAWPGEVRELSNEVSRLYFLSSSRLDNVNDVRAERRAAVSAHDVMPSSFRLDDLERRAIDRALKATGNRRDQAAQLLGISRGGLYAKLRRLGISLNG